MSKYELTAPEKATLESLKKKGAFGLSWEETIRTSGYWCEDNDPNRGDYEPKTFPLTDEAAYALMVQRGLKELGEMWKDATPHGDKSLWFVLARIKKLAYYAGRQDDMLSAIMAAIGDKEDER